METMTSDADDQLTKAAIAYHRYPQPGKISVLPTKQLTNQRDLALAYSPGVAAACEEIVDDPHEAPRYTARGNLVAVITNGTAVLGLGDIGPLAAKPVMEGKAVLFKKFAGIDCSTSRSTRPTRDKLVDIVAALEPTFGGINLEDIKAPECFDVERKLRERMKIPVFHDDQHGTAIIVGGGGAERPEGGGQEDRARSSSSCPAPARRRSRAWSCSSSSGVQRENIWVTDIKGVVYEGRKELDGRRTRRATRTTPTRARSPR